MLQLSGKFTDWRGATLSWAILGKWGVTVLVEQYKSIDYKQTMKWLRGNFGFLFSKGDQRNF